MNSIRPDTRSCRVVLRAILLTTLFVSTSALASTPGLPFTEDFSDASLQDPTLTNANWSTDEQALVLAWRNRRFGSFANVSGSSVSADGEPTYTYALALGDVDGDGDLDLIAGNYGQTSRLYLNNGSSDPWNGVVGSDISSDTHNTRTLAIGDVDGDGDLDLIAGNEHQANRLYFNNGTSDPWNGAVGSDITADAHRTWALALGDVDDDGDLDVIAGNFDGLNRLYLNDGSAALWTASNIGVEDNDTLALALGDVDGDGDLDLVSGDQLQTNHLYLNNGTGNPWSGVTTGITISADADNTRSLTLGDVDGDSDLDLVVGNIGVNKLYLGDGSANPWSGVLMGVDIGTDTDNSRDIALGDIDGDGDLDLVAGNQSAANRLYLNNGSNSPWSDVTTGNALSADAHSTQDIVIGDVDGDGDLDVLAGNQDAANRLYLNGSSADPWSGVSGSDVSADADTTYALVVGDVDGDGDLDLITGNLSDPNRLYLNNGTADPWAGVSGSDVSADTDNTVALALGDVDGDGDLDLIAGNYFQTNRLYLNNGTADPWAGIAGSDVSTDTNITDALAVGDVDGDGDLDLIAGNDGQTNRLYLNNGTSDPWAGVGGSDISADIGVTYALALSDVDGDSDLDLIAGNYGEANRLYLNNGSTDPWGGVSGSDISADTGQTYAIALGDVDRDGDLDLIAGNAGQPNRLYLNNGSTDPWGGVSGSDVSVDTGNTVALALSDVDNDGDLDLIAGNFNEANRLYLNNGSADPWGSGDGGDGVSGSDISADTNATYALALDDVDSDGDLDVIAGNQFQTTRLYLNSGHGDAWGGISGSNITDDALGTFSMALGDVDADGDVDLVIGNSLAPNRLYLNMGGVDPWFGSIGVDIGSGGENGGAVLLGDLDRDGDLDLVSARLNAINRVYLNNGSADPWDAVAGYDIGSDSHTSRTAALGDVDADGDLDLVVGNLGQANRVYLNTGGASPLSGASGSDISTDANQTYSVALGDVDRDGDLDFIAGNTGSHKRLYLNDGSATPWAGVTGTDIGLNAELTYSVALGDIDGDGDLDLVAGNSNFNLNTLYLNDGVGDPWDGQLGLAIGAEADHTLSVALGDIDNDGNLDLLVGNFNQPNRLYLSSPTPTAIDISVDSDLTYAIALADVDGDGRPEVIAGNNTQANRMYRSQLFHTAHGQAASLRVDTATESSIFSVTLSASSLLPPNTGVDYWLSNNAGAQWFLVRPDQAYVFPTVGADLRWKAKLHSLSPALTPLVDSVQIDRETVDQTIAFGANPGPLVFAATGTSVSATATSGLTVSFSSSTPAICSVDSTTGELTLLAAGDCIITADQAGDGNYNAATQVSQTVSIIKADQSIGFGANPGSLVIGAIGKSVSAIASSGLDVNFSSDTPGVCSVDAVSGALTLIAIGDCIISADQAGNGNYNAAPQVSQAVSIVDTPIFKDGFEN